jgi:hypothetical protein
MQMQRTKSPHPRALGNGSHATVSLEAGQGQRIVWSTASSGDASTRASLACLLASVLCFAGCNVPEPPAIGVGWNHTCVIANDADEQRGVKCWGRNPFGQLGLGDREDRGDQTGEMGSNLPWVDLGTGRTTKALAASSGHTCAVLDNGSVKCWGYNADGRLGLGDSTNRGDDLGEMGDNLPTVNLGSGRRAKAVTAGAVHTCALLDDNSVKCWGDGAWLGIGGDSTKDRGPNPSDMGDNLPRVDLGNGRTVKAITAGSSHTCALLDDDSIKCWGSNYSCQLGLGESSGGSTWARGDQPGEMGDNLPTVNLGSGRRAKAVTAGAAHTCALLDDNSVKCWGQGAALGRGEEAVVHRGCDPGEMGENLPRVDLGSGRTAKSVVAGSDFTCAVLDSDAVKCWGANGAGQLGLGATQPRGSFRPGEMGDSLPAVQLGSARTAKSVDAGFLGTCAVLDNDAIKCWGNNREGQLGLGYEYAAPTWDASEGDEPGETGDSLPAVAF